MWLITKWLEVGLFPDIIKLYFQALEERCCFGQREFSVTDLVGGEVDAVVCRTPQIGFCQIGLCKHRLLEIRLAKISFREICFAEIAFVGNTFMQC